MSEVTITDPQHSLFGQRFRIANERSGRGPGYVVVKLPDGRKRALPIVATDLTASDRPTSRSAATLPRISVRTLIPLAQHLDRILNLLTEEVIRDDPTSSSASSRCVSAAQSDRREQLAFGGRSPPVGELAATDASSVGPDNGAAIAADAAGPGRSRKGDVPC